MIRIAGLDHAKVEQALAELESLLDQSDLRTLYARLRAEQEQRPTQQRRPRTTRR